MAATIRIRATPKPTRGGMNRTESAYADHLDACKASGQIKAWYFTPIKFLLAPATTYTPDFLVIGADDTAEFHETKGFMRDDANVKIKVSASMFPFPFFLVYKLPKNKGWDVRPVRGGD